MADFRAYVKLDTNLILKGVNQILTKKQAYIRNTSTAYREILWELQDIVEHRVPYDPEDYHTKTKPSLRDSASVKRLAGKWTLVYDPVDKYKHHYGAAQYDSPKVGSTVWTRATKGTGGYWDKKLPIKDQAKLFRRAKKVLTKAMKEAK